MQTAPTSTFHLRESKKVEVDGSKSTTDRVEGKSSNIDQKTKQLLTTCMVSDSANVLLYKK